MRRRHCRAFTLIELLVVVTIIVLLIGILVPSVYKARTTAKVATCAHNLHENCVAFFNYASLNAGSFPQEDPNINSGLLLWDFSTNLASVMMSSGTNRAIYYCPLNDEQNDPNLWNFQGGNYRVMGYFYLLKRSNTTITYLDNHYQQNIPNPAPLSPPNPALEYAYPKHSKYVQVMVPKTPPPSGYTATLPGPSLEDEELITDVVIENQSTPGDFSNVSLRGWPGHIFSSNHLAGIKPTGGNVAFIDGHTELRPFGAMRMRYRVTSDAVNEWF